MMWIAAIFLVARFVNVFSYNELIPLNLNNVQGGLNQTAPLYCRPDEELYGCINGGCGRWECSQPESGICIDLVPGACVPGCRCREPLLRAPDGRCVPSHLCPRCVGPNEVYSCGPACDNVCSQLHIRNQTHCDILNIQCNPMCYCIEGYARDDNGICIPIESCPGRCGLNEVYTHQGVCQARNCDELGQPLPCESPDTSNPYNQGPGCVCRPGYVRDCNGICIPKTQCPSCGGDPNATGGCGTFCTTCDNYGQSVACIQSCVDNGCACKDGYIYDTANKKCVLPQNCPPKKCKKPNEVLGCKNACPARTCASTRFHILIKCPPQPKDCEKECVCAPDFFRNGAGDCVPREQCFSNITCGPDEEYNGCANGGCGRWLCSQQGVICIDLIEGGCIPGCRCKPPLLRTDDGRCVPSDQCSLPQCGINAEYVECKDYIRRPQTCKDVGFPLNPQAIASIDKRPPVCNQGPGCVCKDGFVKNSDGNCVPTNTCPSCGGDPNATSGCGTFCTTCDNYGQSVACPASCIDNGCECKKGFIFDTANKKCVLPQNCPPKKCTKPNEIMGCKNACPSRTCESTRFKELFICPPQPKICVPECVCAPGFFRNAAGDCVTRDQCYPNTVCRADEEYNGCANGGCGRWLCSQQGVICIDLIEGGCIPGCRCKSPLLRTDDGRCVPSDQCPLPQCGSNEEYVKCIDSISRPQSCANLGFPIDNQAITNNQSPSICNQGPGCVCKDGYVRDDNSRCIPKQECPSCGGDPNATGGCGTFCTTCDNYGQSVSCIASCIDNGCECKKGYVYDTSIKKCVLPQNCPPKKCNKPNEVSGCKNACPPGTCDALDRAFICLPQDQVCEHDCVCAPGYFRNAGGHCVTEEQCRQCSGPNEYFTCGPACDNVCAELSIRNQTHCDIYNIKCNPKCYCLDGYARNANGTCIPIKQCPAQCGENEELSKDPVCRPETCTDVGFPLPCNDPQSGITANQGPGCVCKSGYVRDNNGKCVSDKQCPSCGGDPNAESGCGTFCTTCDNYGQNAPCILLCILNSCACRDGYIYDKSIKKCVLPKHCPAKCNNPNEISACKNSCPPRTCGDIDKQYKCPAQTLPCEQECVCAPGFYRNAGGYCVTREQCIKCSGPNEFYSCGGACDNVCSELSVRNQTHCDIINIKCNEMCYCLDGYARDANGICIPIKQCPVKCGVNEEYSKDGVCRPKTCTDVGFPLPCLDPQSGTNINQGPGCVCQDGYVRDSNGQCVSDKQCPSCGGDPNATTGCGNFCNTCDNYGKPNVVCILPCTLNGCACKNGYVYDTVSKKCVLPKYCPVKCNKPNEISGCKNTCPSGTCADIGKIFNCPLILLPCEQQCVCAPGYYRNSGGYCVTKEQCNQCSGPNEYFTCGGACDNVCSELSIRNQTNCDIINIQCNNKCYCLNGYARDANGICIPIKQCPVQCGQNEEYSKDGVCRPRTCTDVGFPLPCQDPQCTTPTNQGPGCVCKEGFVRDNNNKCVSDKQCPSCGGDPNATTGCGTFCTTCDNYGQNVACILLCKINGCACKDGYIYDTVAKKCVLPKYCPVKCNKPNEISGCKNSCPPRTCADKDKQFFCLLQPQPCEQECICAPGFYRNSGGYCVTKEQCNQCSGPNEYFTCGGACDNVCSELSIRNQTNCDIINIQCNNKCYCLSGYARDANGICIPIKQCPVQCGQNEEYSKDGVCRPRTCTDVGFPLPCQDPQCTTPTNQGPGCVCKEGFVRDNNNKCVSDKQCPSCGGDPNATTGCGSFCATCDNIGQKVACILACTLNGCACKDGYIYDKINKKCVLPQHCPAKCNKPNEISACKSSCPPKTCANKDKESKCPLPLLLPCEQECVCAPGYYRNSGGYCVTKAQCDQCSGPNEYFTCGGACDNVCSELSIRNQTNCDIINIQCNNKCYCLKGYARDANGICIPINKCPVQCGTNEEYSKTGVCRARTCTDVGFPLPCLDPQCSSPTNQGPGCVCKVGYIRDNNNKCVSDKQCPSCGGDPNAESGCGTFCTTCDNYGQNVGCILICRENSCECKKGYIYDKLNKKCVLPKNCPRRCGPNEVYEKAVRCPPQTCESRLALYNCPLQNATSVTAYECRCKPGYLRNKFNVCIPAEQCPPPTCPGKNEEWAPSVSCPPQTCESITARYDCSKFKPPATKYECRCKPGYFRNKINECISTEECGKCTGPNEYYSSSGGACDNVCSELSIRNQTNCDRVNVKPRCYCIKGYARDANGFCIPIDKCPVQCGANEEYVSCPDAVCRPKICAHVGFPIACPDLISCPSKPCCICKEGFVKDKGTCIPYKACPSCGGDENAVSGCGVNCQNTCPGHPKDCTKICKYNSCNCKPGFLLDTVANKCVLPQKCSCGPNEVFSDCTNRACHRNNCAQLSIPWVCRAIALPSEPSASCIPGCECAPGYLKNSDGVCIPQDQCPEANPSNCNTIGDNVNATSELLDGNGVFTSKFLYEAAKNNPRQSVVASPFSVLFLLAQLALFATGAALEQLNALLNLKCSQQIRGTIPPYLISFNSEKNITLRLAERVYGSEKYPFSEHFKDVTKNVFLAEAQNVDFSNPKEAAKIINDWIASQTNNLIQNLVPETSLSADTRLVLTNAIYFKGNWSKPFRKENTQPKDFYVSDSQTVTVQMMNQVSKFNYGVLPQSQSQVVEIPYQNENVTFLVVLPPKTADGMDNLLNEQLNFTSITAILPTLQRKKVDLSLPSFDIETRTDLKDILTKAGVTQIFDSQNSGLSGILEQPENVSVSYASQLAKITVDEFGAEAAAGNAIIVGVTSVGVIEDPVEVYADHNFLYYLLLRGTPIFCGLFAGPQ